MNKSNQSSKINVYIGSDHAGYEMKEKIINDPRLNFINFIDVGTNSNDSVDYPDYAKAIADNVVKNNAYGIGICGTGIGISVALNKFNGIYTAVITDPNIGKLARQHNNLNVISLSGRFNSLDTNIEIIKNFFNETFEERHQKRLDKIKKIENNNY